jgi:hypothetical protein
MAVVFAAVLPGLSTNPLPMSAAGQDSDELGAGRRPMGNYSASSTGSISTEGCSRLRITRFCAVTATVSS